jgi:hypothetical protein
MSVSILRISRPRGDARLVCRFVHQLTVRSGVTVGARRSATTRGQWQIVWYDGPTVIAMRRHAAELGRAVVGVDLDTLTWERTARVVRPVVQTVSGYQAWAPDFEEVANDDREAEQDRVRPREAPRP